MAIGIGRDKLFAIMNANQIRVYPKRNYLLQPTRTIGSVSMKISKQEQLLSDPSKCGYRI